MMGAVRRGTGGCPALMGVWMTRPRCLLASAAALCAGLAAAPTARAQDYLRTGWYAGARGVYTQEDFDIDASVDDDFGFNVFAGYRLFSFLGSDFEFEYIDALAARGKPAGPNFDVRTFNLSWNFRFYPLAFAFEPSSPFQRVQPYLAAGVANQWVTLNRVPSGDEHKGNFAGRLGAGIDFYLTPNLALTTNGIYTLGTGEVSEFRYWSIGWGFLYRFGGEEDGSSGGSSGGGKHGEKAGEDEDDESGGDEE